MSTLDLTTIKSKLSLSPTKFNDKDDKEIGTLCRAWVNFDGTGAGGHPNTITPRASFNVTSVTDNTTGDYTINFTNAIVDINYCPICSGDRDGSGDYHWGNSVVAISLTQCRVYTYGTGTGGKIDHKHVTVAIFR